MSKDREKELERLSSLHLKITNHGYLHYKPLFENLNSAIKEFANGRLLDIGCGNKPYAEWINPVCKEYVGVDVIQSNQNKVDLICEAINIPLEDGVFDTVFSTQALEHIAEHGRVISEAYRLLKPGGYFILSAPMYWPLHEEPYDFFRFTKHGFRHLLVEAGFDVVQIQSCGGKWTVLGQTILFTVPTFLSRYRIVRYFHNKFFSWLDQKYYDDTNTINYVVVGLKPVKKLLDGK